MDTSEIVDITVKTIFLILGFYLTYLAHKWKTNKEKMELIEKSFMEMQRFNELILSDEENLKAAVLAVNPDTKDSYNKEQARICYIHLLCINCLYRVWLYHERGFLKKEKRDEIILAHARTLATISDEQFDALLQRGYTDEFKRDLKKWLAGLEPANPLF
jgi:hypothetical protein